MKYKKILILILFFFIFTFFNYENALAAPYIYIQSPSSGDIIYMQEYHIITWYSDDLESNYVSIELYKGNNFIRTIHSFKFNDGSYRWYVPTNFVEGNDYRIKISDYYNNSIYAFSNYFTINVRRSITITAPLSYHTWYKGDNNIIRWNSQNAGSYINISLYKNNNFYRLISSNAYNNGNFYWNIPTNLGIDDDYQIKITSNAYSSVYDLSQKFTIDERTIHVSSPENGEVWFTQQEYAIQWNSKNIGNRVRIDLYENNNFISTIESNIDNNGEYTWTVDSDLSENSIYRLKISSRSYSNIYDFSGNFSINKRTLSFTTDFLLNSWYQGEEYLIKWNENNAGDYVDIILYKNNNIYRTIAIDIENTGMYIWRIPNTIETSDEYHLLIYSTTYSYVRDESTKFTIGGREIEILNPIKNEVLYKEEIYDIKWESINAGEKIDIILYKNNEEILKIASNINISEGLYKWKIPSDLSEGKDYQIKIISNTYSDVSAISEKITIEKNFFNKIFTPLMIIIGTIIVIISAVGLNSFIKKRHNKSKIAKKTTITNYNTYPKNDLIRNDFSQKEYDNIWEKKKF